MSVERVERKDGSVVCPRGLVAQGDAGGDTPAAVVFVCQDTDHRDRFAAAADWQLAASQRRWAELNPQDEYPVRDRVLFAIEEDIRAGRAEATRPPHHPPKVSDRDERFRGVWLPGAPHD